jgi:RsiW-degrading membrane proteinase PrsW (M82 family)
LTGSDQRRLGSPGVDAEPAHGAAHEDTYRERPIGQTGDEPALAGMAATVGTESFVDLYARRLAATRPVNGWLAVLGVVIVAGPLGILGAFGAVTAQLTFFGILAIVFLGPAIEEITKALGAVVLVERYPWLIPAAWVIPVMTVAGGLGFAAIENAIYLNVYIEDPTPEIIRWRWIFGPLVHGASSLLVGVGLAKVWLRSTTEGLVPTLEVGRAWIAAGVAFHGGYNLVAVILEATDVI